MKLFLTLFNMSITASWLVLAVILMRLLFSKVPKAWRCMLWALVAVRLVCPFSVTSVFSMIPSRETIPQEMIEYGQPIIDSGIHAVNSAVNPVLSGVKETNLLSKWIEAGAAVWMVGAAIMLIYAVVTYISLCRKTKTSVKRENGIRLCDHISDPFILGLFRPKILIPSIVSSGDMKYIIAHEKAHIKRLDHIWKPIGFLLLSVYWFNPVLWVAYVLLCRDIELACDEKVIAQWGEKGKKAYSTALIHCSAPKIRIAACPLAFGEIGVKSRVKAILNYRKPTLWILGAAIIASGAAVLFFMTDPFQYVSDVMEPGSMWKAVNYEADFQVDENYGIDGRILVENGEIPICIMYRERYAEIYDYPAEVVHNSDVKPVITAGIRVRGNKLHFILYEDGLNLGVKRLVFEKTGTVSPVGEVDQPAEVIDWHDATVLVCEESPDFISPTILLSPHNNRFQFNWSMLSSYIAMGTYEVTEEELILTTDDELQNVYVFRKTFAGYRFVEEKSSHIPQYKYSQGGEAESPVPDGALFEGMVPIEADSEILKEGYSVEMHSVIADIDGDGIDEYCSLSPGPTSGVFSFCFSATEVGAEEREYYNVFTSEYNSLSFVMDAEGKVKLRGENPINHTVRMFDISVRHGDIVLEDDEDDKILRCIQ